MHPAVRAFEQNLLSYGQSISDVKAAADSAPDEAALNAYAASAEMFAMTGDAPAKAAGYIARAKAAAHSPDDRLLVRATAAWVGGDLPSAIALHRERLKMRPDDLAAAKICQLHHLDMGDATGLLETVGLVYAANPENHYVLGQLAFALEQSGDLSGSEAAARHALERAKGDDPWSHHALAHALYSQGRIDEAIAWIEAQAELWARSSSFMQTHAWWHAAISHLDADRTEAALQIYDERLLEACPNCVQSLINAVSLLARLMLRGIDVGERWDTVADRLVERADDRVNDFLDLHYLYGLALAGRHRHSAMMLGALADSPVSAGAYGLIAHANGRHVEAAEFLHDARTKFQGVGGSSEQRDLFELVELDACLASGKPDRARAILSRRIAARPTITWQRRALDGLAQAA